MKDEIDKELLVQRLNWLISSYDLFKSVIDTSNLTEELV